MLVYTVQDAPRMAKYIIAPLIYSAPRDAVHIVVAVPIQLSSLSVSNMDYMYTRSAPSWYRAEVHHKSLPCTEPTMDLAASWRDFENAFHRDADGTGMIPGERKRLLSLLSKWRATTPPGAHLI